MPQVNFVMIEDKQTSFVVLEQIRATQIVGLLGN